MNSNWYKTVFKFFHISYGDNMLLKGAPFIYKARGATIKLGMNITIKSSFLSNLIGLYQRTIIVARASGAKVIIGNGVGISGATIYARKGIYIGDNTCIGGNCKIIDNDFHPIEAEKRNILLKARSSDWGGQDEWIGTKPIRIGKNCFIGCNSIILKGTELGDGCVVGAGAVVSGKYEANSVIIGNPARVIKVLNPNGSSSRK